MSFCVYLIANHFYKTLPLPRSFGEIVLAPPGQHTAFQLHGVLKSPRPKQADRGYAAVGTQTNGDDWLMRIELQTGKTVLQRTDGYTHRTGYVAAPPFRPTSHIDNLYGLIAAHKMMKFVGADLGNTSEWQPPELFFQLIHCRHFQKLNR